MGDRRSKEKGKEIWARDCTRGTDFRAYRAPGIPLPSLSNIFCHAGIHRLILLGLVEMVFSYSYINLVLQLLLKFFFKL